MMRRIISLGVTSIALVYLSESKLFAASNLPLIDQAETRPKTEEVSKELTGSFSEEYKVTLPSGQAVLVNMNRSVNRWFRLKLPKNSHFYHLENVDPKNRITLTHSGLEIANAELDISVRCPLFENAKYELSDKVLKSSKSPFFKICKGLAFIRLKRKSDTQLSSTEKATSILRNYGTWGESLINAVKPMMVMMDAEIAEVEEGRKVMLASMAPVPYLNSKSDPKPPDAIMSPEGKKGFVGQHNLGVSLADGLEKGKQMPYGRWVPTSLHKDIWVSLFAPGLVSEDIAESYPKRVAKLKQNERHKMVYMTAWDLSKFKMGFSIGTTYPGIANDKQEGLNDIVPIGKIPPWHIDDAVSVFIGGFKSAHGTIRRGPFKGRTYGYIEGGVELRPMSPGLSTVMIDKNGSIDIGIWPESVEEQTVLKKNLASARQNGVPLIQDREPGKLVNNWGAGNWSGDAKGNLLTLRSAACIVEHKQRRYLVFAGFTSATPSSVAKTLQAYQCRDAMHLDMNAWMYIHNAIMKKTGDKVVVEYLHKHMRYPKNTTKHRFIYDNNERDFFYVRRSRP